MILTKKIFDFFRAINKIFKHKQSTKKTLINKLSTRLLGLKLKSDNIIESKTLKMLKKIFPDYQ